MKRGVRKDFCQKVGCFACDPVRWTCSALEDTDFGQRECPFYKPKAQFVREQESCREKARRRGYNV